MDRKDLINKWLLDDLNEEETIAFNELEDASFFDGIISDAKFFKASDFSEMPEYTDFKKRIPSSPRKERSFSLPLPFLRIASIMIVAFGLYYFLVYDTNTVLETAVVEKSDLLLPDDTRVVLNSESKISFSEKDWSSKRDIELQGEAFFDVAKGSRFDVRTPMGMVSVLGTEFNVKHRNNILEVSCFEGKVLVTYGNETKILEQGDNFRFANEEVLSGKHSFDAPQWTENKSYFERIPVSEVFSEIERQFGVSIQLDNINENQFFTGGFDHSDLEEALLAVTQPLDINYEILKQKIVRLSTRE